METNEASLEKIDMDIEKFGGKLSGGLKAVPPPKRKKI